MTRPLPNMGVRRVFSCEHIESLSHSAQSQYCLRRHGCFCTTSAPAAVRWRARTELAVAPGSSASSPIRRLPMGLAERCVSDG